MSMEIHSFTLRQNESVNLEMENRKYLITNPGGSKPDRKTVEKNRRNEMKNLFTQLNSLLPHPPPTIHSSSSSSSKQEVSGSLVNQIDEATRYIKKLQAHLESLKEKKRNMGGDNRLQRSMGSSESVTSFKPPHIEVYAMGNSALEVVLITGLDCQFIFTEAIRVLHDEGLEVVNASFSTSDVDNVFHTIHAKIEEPLQSQEVVARITQRLKRFSFDP